MFKLHGLVSNPRDDIEVRVQLPEQIMPSPNYHLHNFHLEIDLNIERSRVRGLSGVSGNQLGIAYEWKK